MSEPRDTDALAALAALASRLRETAAAVAERADSAARSGPLSGTPFSRPTDAETPPHADSESPGWGSADFGALIDLAGALRESVPEDLRDRLSGSVRDTLMSTRALIDWYLERDAANRADAAVDSESVEDSGTAT